MIFGVVVLLLHGSGDIVGDVLSAGVMEMMEVIPQAVVSMWQV